MATYNSNNANKRVLAGLALLLATMLPTMAMCTTLPGDLNGDRTVTWADMSLFASSWLSSDCNDSLNAGCTVDFADYAILASDWLKWVPEVRGNVYYVATDGSDSNPGTSSLPWATIIKAGNTMVAGDTVIVRPGTYNGQVTVANSGSYEGCGLGDSPITFLADPSGDVILNANGSTFGFLADTKKYLVIDGFKITGSASRGIRLKGDGYSYDIIRNCQIYGNTYCGLEVFQADRVTVENCVFYGNGAGGGLLSSGTCNTLVVRKCIVYGNTQGMWLDSGNPPGDSTVTDCIITGNTTGVQAIPSHVFTYCDVWGNGTNYTGGAVSGTGCISADPLFVNPATDFHLGVGSPCIGTASDAANMGYKYAPLAYAGAAQTAYVNQVVTFDASDSKGSIISYAWDFNDTATGSGKITTHTYYTAGNYTVRLTVSDGSTSDTGTCAVEVLPAKPTEIVYHVTNLNSSGAGSFASCLNSANSDGSASRIVFDVGGTIHSPASTTLSENNTTICGTEAPSPGITFDFDAAHSGFVINGDYCRMCNLTIKNTYLGANGTDGFNVNGHYNILERLTVTNCTDEGVGVTGGYGHIVAFCYIANNGSITTEGNGRGLAVWYGASAVVVGNFITTNLRGCLFGDYGTTTFVDFRNNCVYNNTQTYGVNINGAGATANFIDNLITANPTGIKYIGNAVVYKSGNIMQLEDTTLGAPVLAPDIITRANTPFPSWLKNVQTPPAPPGNPNVGMGTGKCQCILCR